MRGPSTDSEAAAADTGVSVEAFAFPRFTIADPSVGALHVKVTFVLRAIVLASTVVITRPLFPSSLWSVLVTNPFEYRVTGPILDGASAKFERCLAAAVRLLAVKADRGRMFVVADAPTDQDMVASVRNSRRAVALMHDRAHLARKGANRALTS